MSNKKIYWTADGSSMIDIKPHTRAKHLLLEEYVKNWIDTLCGNHGWCENTVTLIDGFCGGGIYKDGESLWEGSPIRMMKMVEEGHRIVKEERSKPYHKLNVKFIFIDQQQEHIDCLKKQIINYGFEYYLKSDQCIFICKEFEEALDDCLSQIKKGYSFFFLDPFGIDDIGMKSIRKIINLNRSEILWAFMVKSLVRLLPKRDMNKRIIQELLEADEYYQDIPDNRQILMRQQYIKNESLNLIRDKSQVKYLYPFALMEDKNTVLYYLVHLANDPKAIEVMKYSTWKYNNLEYRYHHDTYGSGFRTLEYFNENYKFMDIGEDNYNVCLQDLYTQITPIINFNQDGIELGEIYRQILEKNPGTIDHLRELVNQLREYKEVEVIKPNGKIFTGEKIDKKYKIVKPIQPTIFDLRPIINKLPNQINKNR